MYAQVGMPARLFERSVGIGPEWRVENVWLESPESGDEELHIRVGRTPGAAVFDSLEVAGLNVGE